MSIVSNEETKILSDLKVVMNAYGSLREHLHQKVLIPSVLYAWKNQDSTIISKVLNALVFGKEFRVEALAFWYQDLAGFECNYNSSKNAYSCKISKAQGSELLGFDFTRNKEHLDHLKNGKNRFWIVAPVTVKELTLNDDLSKIFSSVEKTLAKGMILNQFSIEDIKAYLDSKLVMNVVHNKQDKSVKAWAEKYLEQELAKELA